MEPRRYAKVRVQRRGYRPNLGGGAVMKEGTEFPEWYGQIEYARAAEMSDELRYLVDKAWNNVRALEYVPDGPMRIERIVQGHKLFKRINELLKEDSGSSLPR